MRDALQLFDKVIGVNKNITSKIVEENLNTVDFDTYTELINDIKSLNLLSVCCLVSVSVVRYSALRQTCTYLY